MLILELGVMLCLSIGDAEPVSIELSQPPTVQGERVIFSDQDQRRIAWEIQAEPPAFRLVDPNTAQPAAHKDGSCWIGHFYAPPPLKARCSIADQGPLCLKCQAPAPSEPAPIAAMR